MPMIMSRLCCVLLATGLSAPFLRAQDTRPSRPVPVGVGLTGSTTAPDLSRVRTAADGAKLLRDLWSLQDYNSAVDAGMALVRRFPTDARLAAWLAVNLVNTAHADRADSVAARLDSTGRDPMVTGLATWVRLYRLNSNRSQQKRLVARLSEMATRTRSEDLALLLQDMSTRVYSNDYARAVDVVDSIAKAYGDTPLLRMKALQWRYYAARFGEDARDTAVTGRAIRDVVAWAQRHPGDVRMLQMAASVASSADRSELEQQYLTMMLARSPRSSAIRADYWSALGSTKGLSVEERNALIDLDRRYYLTLVDSAPWALGSVLSSTRRTHKGSADIAALERLIETRVPRTAWQERVLEARVNQWNDSLRLALDTTKAVRPDSVYVRKRYLAAIDAFLNKGWTAQQSLSNGLTLTYFGMIMNDSTAPTEPLVRTARRMLAHEELNGPWLVMAARALADRGVALGTADSLARKGEALSLDQLLWLPSRSIGEQAEMMDMVKAQTQDALGWSALKAGRLADAEKFLAKGIELTKRDANLYLHLGRLRMAQGRPSDAELAWAEGMTVKSRGVNPNRAELEALYKRQHGSLEGWTPYIAALEEKERATRKARILAKREEKPFMPPTLADIQLSGDSVKLATLTGKTVVVNFWGTWCGPCVAEMPELQQFYDKYKNDSTVKILTVANDDERETLVKWMTERRHTIPTVWSKPYTTSSGINAWPTTWFIGPDGRVQYQMIGNAGQLVEEWSWLVEALRGSGRPAGSP